MDTPDTPYTNRELREHWHNQNNALAEILVQTKKTNGAIADINRWRERINGAAFVGGFFVTVIVVPVLSWAIYVLVNINQTIHASVDQALSAYDVQVK